MAVQLMMMAAMTFVRMSLEKPPKPRSIPELTEMQIQSSEYGMPIPKVYGGIRIAGNVIWATDITERVYKGTSIGKYVSLAIGICEGVKDRILRVWANGEMIYDQTGGNESAVKFDELNMTFYSGDETQTPDPLMVAEEGADNVPAYRGLCYVVIEDFPLADFGDSVPNLEFQVASSVNEVVSYTALTGVAASPSDRDRIVVFPDGIHFLIQSSDVWYKINTLSNSILLQVDHSGDGIPMNDGGFDVDEEGNVHTSKDGGSGFANLCKLDRDNLVEIATDSTPIHYPKVLRVFKTSDYPYVVGVLINGGVGETLYITNRDTYNGDLSLSVPTGNDWVSVDLDETEGVVWAVSTGQLGGTATAISKIALQGSITITYTRTDYTVTSSIQKGDAIMFDSDTNQVIVGSASQSRIAFFDADDMSHLGSIDFSNVEQFDLRSVFQRGAVDGYLYAAFRSTTSGNHVVYEIDVVNRTLSDSWELDESGLCTCGTGDEGGSCYDTLTHAMILACTVDSATDYIKMLLNRGQAQGVLLSSIVEDVCAEVGLDGSSDVDASALTDIVYGYAVIERETARDALEPLMRAFFFDCVDTGGALKFVKRGGSAVLNIPENHLAAHLEGDERPQKLVTTRQQELELPVRVDVSYIDKDSKYAVGEQSEKRLITDSSEILSLRLPIAMSANDAKQIAVKTLASTWANRIRHTVQASREYSRLDPGDVITVTEGSNTHTARVDNMECGGPVTVLYLVNEDTAAYTSDATGADLPPDEPGVNHPGPTTLVLLDIPLLSVGDNSLGFYVATLGYTDAWEGASVVQSEYGTWTGFERPILISRLDAVLGKATTVLGNVTDPWVWDKGNTVTIRLLDDDDSLSSVTEVQMLNGSNRAMLGDEIIQWKTATQNGDGTWTLSGAFLRGRRGSEWATGTHAAGEWFVLLDASLLTFTERGDDELDAWRWYRAWTLNSREFSVTQPFMLEGRNMMPYSPQHVKATRDGSGNITITWQRRTRIGGELADGGDVGLGETSENYDVEIYDGSTLKRTLEVTSESATYTAAQQTTDFGGLQSSVDVIIYQVSSVVDQGFGTSATV